MSSNQESADVMIDVAPEVVVYRKDGRWYWHANGLTKAHVIKEIKFQIERAVMKTDLLKDALMGLEDSVSGNGASR